MSHEPIAERLEHDWDAFTSHLHKHHSVTMQPAITRTPPEAAMSGLITTIENDLTAVGHEVSGILHGILAKHLTLENIAAHVAQGVATAQGDPLVQLGESLLPGGGAVIADFVGKLATFLAPTTQAVAAAPAEVPAGEPAPVA
jgi:hypothetical protein